MISQAIHKIFHDIADLEEHTEFLVNVSYLEVYNENIRGWSCDKAKETLQKESFAKFWKFVSRADLLVYGVSPPVNLDVREEQNTGIVVVGLSQPKVTCAEQVLGLISQGNLTRTMGSTGNFEPASLLAIFCP